jgi:putative transcriptional regulator
MMNREKYARRLKELRGDRTQEKVAEELNIAQSSYAMYETGQRIPSDEKKIKLAEYYGTTVQDIFF